MPWDGRKCNLGTPVFNDTAAAAAVNNADFSKAFYVIVSEQEGKTKSAYTYLVVNSCRICVVGHVHRVNAQAPWDIAGKCYIPGWTGDGGAGWDLPTPGLVVDVIGRLPERGDFPYDQRYPHPVP